MCRGGGGRTYVVVSMYSCYEDFLIISVTDDNVVSFNGKYTGMCALCSFSMLQVAVVFNPSSIFKMINKLAKVIAKLI